MSSLYCTQDASTDAGVEAELHVWDSLWHTFIMDLDLPESKQIYRVVGKLFGRHLGAK